MQTSAKRRQRQTAAVAGAVLALGVAVPTLAEFNQLQDRVAALEQAQQTRPTVPPTTPTTRPPVTTTPPQPVPPAPPGNVCSISPGQGEVAIMAAIRGCPDGSTVRFPANQSYRQANRIVVADRTNLTIDGNGSTFVTTANGRTTQAINGNWVLLRGRNVTLKNMTAVGSFDIPGPRSLAKENVREYTEASMNYGVYGTQGAWLVDVKGFKAWGDTLTLGPAHYVDDRHRGTTDYANDVHVIRMEAATASRHCFAPTSGTGVWIEDSTCRDAWYAGLDAELDGVEQVMKDHHYLRNTFEGFNLGGLLVPVPGETGRVSGIEIRGNRFLTPPDVECNQTVLVGGYPSIGEGYEFADVVIEENEIRSYARAIQVDHVNGGSIRNNRITQLVPESGATVLQHCGEDRQVIVTNSTGVEVDVP